MPIEITDILVVGAALALACVGCVAPDDASYPTPESNPSGPSARQTAASHPPPVNNPSGPLARQIGASQPAPENSPSGPSGELTGAEVNLLLSQPGSGLGKLEYRITS